jgi:hypothetical protein
MTITELKQIMGDAKEVCFQGKCHDCGIDTEVVVGIEGDKLITSCCAVYKVPPPSIREDNIFIKCESCFRKNTHLSNFRKCEIYSRVVGYLRPVNQFNKGKQAEFKARTPYNLAKTIKEV